MPTGWQGSTRRSRLPKNWAQIRFRVLRRDGSRCQWVREDTGQMCGLHATEVDHIVPSGSDDLSNLRSLCSYHHALKSSAEGGAASKRSRARSERVRRSEMRLKHPGIL
jgi:5-methylcytosine-specific restriction endonuclease McrA